MKHMKKMLCVVLSMTLILLCAGIASPAAAGEEAVLTAGTDSESVKTFYLGDANVDGIVDIMDATAIQRMLAKYDVLTFKGERLGDTDLSGDVDIMDATMIQRYLVHYNCPAALGEPVATRTMSFESGESFRFDLNDGSGESQVAQNNIRWWSMNTSKDTTIKGTVEVHLRLKADNLNFDKTAVKVCLVDLSANQFENYCGDMNTAYVSSTALYGSSDGVYIPIRQFSQNYMTQMFFTHGMIDIGTPDAGWLPQSAVAPLTQVKENEWHDYTIYLEPEVYTVRAGHTLYIGVEPKLESFSGYTEVGTITVDQSASYAVIPTDANPSIRYNR